MAHPTFHPFAVRTDGPVTVVRFAGPKLDAVAVRAMADDLDGLIGRPGQTELRLDFRDVGYLGSEGLAKVVTLHRRMGTGGGKLVLLNLVPVLADLFRVTHLDTVLDIRRSWPALPA